MRIDIEWDILWGSFWNPQQTQKLVLLHSGPTKPSITEAKTAGSWAPACAYAGTKLMSTMAGPVVFVIIVVSGVADIAVTAAVTSSAVSVYLNYAHIWMESVVRCAHDHSPWGTGQRRAPSRDDYARETSTSVPTATAASPQHRYFREKNLTSQRGWLSGTFVSKGRAHKNYLRCWKENKNE